MAPPSHFSKCRVAPPFAPFAADLVSTSAILLPGGKFARFKASSLRKLISPVGLPAAHR